MERDTNEYVVTFTRAGTENLFHPEEEDVTEENPIKELGREVSGQDVEGFSNSDPEAMEEEDILSVH